MIANRKLVGIALAISAGAVTLAPVSSAFAQSYYDTRTYYDNDQARRDYDARYGYGAYDRYYAAQAEDARREARREERREERQEQRYDANQAQYDAQYQARRDYDARYGEGAYDRYYAAQGDQTYREDRRDCRKEKNGNTAAGAILGGIAGAVIGSNLASGGGRTGGAVIGGVAGAAGGSAIARSTVHCDD